MIIDRTRYGSARAFRGLWVVLVIVVLSIGGIRLHAADAPLDDVYCPVTTDEKVDAAFWLDHEGARVYFCCRKCRTEFQNNPEPYLANLPKMPVHGNEEAPHDHGGHDHAGDSQDSGPVLAVDDTHDHAHHGEDGTDAMGAGHGDEDSGGHDHSDHAHGETSVASRAMAFLGKFHPVLVHFPIALVLVVLLAEILQLATGRALFASASRFLMPVAALSAVVAASFGWMAGESASYTGALAETLSDHRWLGVSAAIVSVLAASLQWAAEARHSKKLRWTYRLVLLIGCVLVGLAGHLGASLIYGLDYFTF